MYQTDPLCVPCPDACFFLFFFNPCVHLCWSDFSVRGTMTALQSKVLCLFPKTCRESLHGTESIPSDSFRTESDPSVFFFIMRDGATSDGECLNILFWEKTHQTGMQVLSGYLTLTEMQNHSLSHHLWAFMSQIRLMWSTGFWRELAHLALAVGMSPLQCTQVYTRA